MVDTRVKERLTGAIILVALLVLLVPELLSGPGQASATNHPASTDGQQMRSYTIDLAEDASARRSASAPLAETPMAATPGAPVEATANDAQPARDVSPSDDAPSVERAPSESPAAAAAAQSGSATPTPAAKPPAAARPAPATRDDTPARPAPAAARVVSASKPSSGGWAVQVGSFASRENAERLARDLRGKGFDSHVSQSSGNGKRLWRVRVGSEPDRDGAVALGTRLRAAGQSGSVVPAP